MKLFKQTTISNFIKTYLFVFCLSIQPSVGKNITIKSFYEAKLILNQIHSLNKKTKVGKDSRPQKIVDLKT